MAPSGHVLIRPTVLEFVFAHFGWYPLEPWLFFLAECCVSLMFVARCPEGVEQTSFLLVVVEIGMRFFPDLLGRCFLPEMSKQLLSF